MDCPYCDEKEQSGSRVIDTRAQKDRSMRRRRECLGPKKHRFVTFETVADEDALAHGVAPERRRMPREHEAIGHRFSIAGHEGLITAGKFEDGSVGEVSLAGAGKDGALVAGLMSAYATALSIALQYGVPLETLVRAGSYMRFEPEGLTQNPEIPFAKSIPDYVMRWLASRFIDDAETLEELGIMTSEVRAKQEAEMSGNVLSGRQRRRG
jgi:ribonucleoside-diphosphate reductase alpha chain